MIYEKLTKIQCELKAPKSKYNSFGKYNYRSLEDILEAVKPLLAKYNVSLFMQDAIVEKGNRFYVQADAYLYDVEDKTIVQTSALAREEDEKKGMDGSQITGTASSYARKYCLNGLFLIDDTKDADTDEFRNESEGRVKAEAKKAEFKKSAESDTLSQLKKTLVNTAKQMQLDATTYLKKVGWEEGTEATEEQVTKALGILKNISEEREKNANK